MAYCLEVEVTCPCQANTFGLVRDSQAHFGSTTPPSMDFAGASKLESAIGARIPRLAVTSILIQTLTQAAFASQLEEFLSRKDITPSLNGRLLEEIDELGNISTAAATVQKAHLDRRGTMLWNLACKLDMDAPDIPLLGCLGTHNIGLLPAKTDPDF